MADVNVQIKQRNGSIWDELFPVTKASNVITDSTHRFVTDANISAWNGKQDAIGFTPENVANKNQPNGYAGLGSDGKIPDNLVPKIAISDTFVVSSQSAMLALTAEVGDVCVRTDLFTQFILKATPASTLSNWIQFLNPASPVSSVNGKTGAVTLNKSDVGLPSGINMSVSSTEPTTFSTGDIWLSIV